MSEPVEKPKYAVGRVGEIEFELDQLGRGTIKVNGKRVRCRRLYIALADFVDGPKPIEVRLDLVPDLLKNE